MTDTIHTAMLAIMEEVGYVKKSRTMKGFETYRFAGEAEFIKAIRPAMVAHGVYCYPSAITSHESETYQTSKGTTMNLEKVGMEFTFVHGASGTEIKVAAMGAGADVGDKAVPKMLTGALKYALRQSFLIETGDDPDNTGSADQGRADERGSRQFSHNRPPFVPENVPPAEEPAAPTLREKLAVPAAWQKSFMDAARQRGLKASDINSALVFGLENPMWNELIPAAYRYCEVHHNHNEGALAKMLDEIEPRETK